jgi:hypothetical protein
MSKFLLGSDPEFIVSKDGVIVPYMIEENIDLEGFVTITKDNVLLELNTMPASSRKEFIQIHDDALILVKEYIGKNFGLKLTRLNAHDFGELHDPEFHVYGCSPTFNLYDNSEELEHKHTTERYCGGHIHIGARGKDIDFSRNLIRNCDYHIGLNLDEMPSKRREVYGKAGEFRVMEHVKTEYRTPSNDWVFGQAGWIYDQTEKAFNDTEAGVVQELNYQEINKIKVTC